MKVYHVDTSGKITTGDWLTLSPVDDDAKYDVLRRMFPGGISTHGERYLYDESWMFYSFPTVAYNTAEKKAETVDVVLLQTMIEAHNYSASRLCDFNFELVRREFFSGSPSRYQSFFALPSIDDIAHWPELTKQPYRIFEVEIDGAPHLLDAQWLRGGFNFAQKSTYQHAMSFAPPLVLNQAFHYWKGDQTDSPKWEYLLNLPLQIGREALSG